MAREIQHSKIKAQIDVYTNHEKNKYFRDNHIDPNATIFRFHAPQLDLSREMGNADYVCQLSDCESFCYTVYEALLSHTPVLVTDWNGIKNVVKDGKNGYIYDMGLTNFSPKQLLARPNHFSPIRSSNEQWKKYLATLPLIHDIEKTYNYFFL